MSSRASLYLGDETYQRLKYEQNPNSSYELPAGDEQSERPGVSYWCNSRLKRWFDLALAVPGLFICAPLFAGVAVAIKLTSRGPVFFRQLRVGKNQVAFIILKFRTMSHLAEQCGPSVTRCGDPRLTNLGSFLRRSKLDELPQLFNVLKGDMSLVGPRPKLAQHEKMFMACRPGITGAATIVFSDEERMLAHIPEPLVEQHALAVFNPIKIKLDEEYQRKASLATDILILARTLMGSRSGFIVEPSALDHTDIECDSPQSVAPGVYDDREFAPFPATRPLLD